MRPISLSPHVIYLPRPGAPHQRLSQVTGWWGRPERATYRIGAAPLDPTDTPEGLSSGVVASYRIRHPEVTASEKIVRCLAWLEQFAMNHPRKEC